MDRNTIGRLGERMALQFLKKRGYKIVDSNFRTDLGEVDIVAYDKQVLVFIEVKTRSLNCLVEPEASVGQRKKRKLRQLADLYMKMYKLEGTDCRIDVVSIVLDRRGDLAKFQLIKGAFGEDNI